MRALWLAIAAAIAVVAVVGVTIVVQGPLGDTSLRSAMSAIAIGLAGAVAVAGLALLDRPPFAPLGGLVLVAAPFLAGAMLYGVWAFEGDGEDEPIRWAWTGVAWTAATLVVATQPLLTRSRALGLALAPAVAVASVVAAAFLTAAVWTEGDHVKAISAFGIVAFAGWLATAALERARRSSRPRV